MDLRINFGKKPSADHSSSSPSHYPLASRPKQDSKTRRLSNFCIGNMGKYIIKSLFVVDDDHEGNVTGTSALPSDLRSALSSIPVLSHPPHHQLTLGEVLGKSSQRKVKLTHLHCSKELASITLIFARRRKERIKGKEESLRASQRSLCVCTILAGDTLTAIRGKQKRFKS